MTQPVRNESAPPPCLELPILLDSATYIPPTMGSSDAATPAVEPDTAEPPDTGSSTVIIFCKNKSFPTDPYEAYFRNPPTPREPFTPVFVPPLEHTTIHQSQQNLKAILQNPTIPSTYSGFVLTSARAVETYVAALLSLPHGTPLPTTLPHYVVGPATHNALAQCELIPRDVIYGRDCGTGEKLAKYIEQHHTPQTTLLFLAGETHRDTLSRTLMDEQLPEEQRIGVETLALYRTVVREDFMRSVSDELRRWAPRPELCGEGDDAPPKVWVVLFSPQGAVEVLRASLVGDVITEGADAAREWRRRRKRLGIATIGPTTRECMMKELDFEPDVCATKPTPEGLAEAIAEFSVYKGYISKEAHIGGPTVSGV
ncbi:MAG: hypothetical protein M1833_002329 [Piccolia ochrophora]|nr:MAG: hypothetical protein M1833_002329 [Piccolia ochrophora]